MDIENFLSFCDSPQRSSSEEIRIASEFINSENLVPQILNGFLEAAFILDYNRQIVFNNKKAEEIFNLAPEDFLGKRFGEVLECIRSNEMPYGCGTTKYCRYCGAAKSISYTRDTIEVSLNDCKILAQKGNKTVTYNFKIQTTPLQIDNLNFVLLSIKDQTSEFRYQFLERIFFHDLMNSAGAIASISSYLEETQIPEEREELIKILLQSSQQLISEIETQKDLRNAETGRLELRKKVINANLILKISGELYKTLAENSNKNLQINYVQNDVDISTDQTLLIRSIGNIIKNAFEAASKNSTISLSAETLDSSILFKVHNDSYMPLDVQAQLFIKSFSTKSQYGRGLGTYSVKLFVEQYLNGKVSFTSDESNGTMFIIEIPYKI